MKTRVVFILTLVALLVVPVISMGKQNILEDIFRNVVEGLANPNGQNGSVLEDSAYGQEFRYGGVTIKYKVFASSRSDRKRSYDSDVYLREVNPFRVLYVGKETDEVFFQIDLINPRGRDISIMRLYASKNKGNNSRVKREREYSTIDNMENTRLRIPITRNNRGLTYHNEIIIVISVDGKEVFKTKNFICIKNR